MAKIKFGNQSGDSKFSLDVLTSSESKTKITLGDQRDRSVREARVVDLPPGIDMSRLAADLSALLAQLNRGGVAPNPEAAAHLRDAEKAAKAGDRSAAGNFLAKAGGWALDLARSAGKEVAVAALKAALGF